MSTREQLDTVIVLGEYLAAYSGVAAQARSSRRRGGVAKHPRRASLTRGGVIPGPDLCLPCVTTRADRFNGQRPRHRTSRLAFRADAKTSFQRRAIAGIEPAHNRVAAIGIVWSSCRERDR
jgi:hypothetical protein